MFKEIVDEITHLATDGASDAQDDALNLDCMENISEFQIEHTSIAYNYLGQLVECKCGKQNNYTLTNATIGYEVVVKLFGDVKPKSHWNVGIDDSIRLGLKMIKSGWLILHGQHRFHIGQISIVKNPATIPMSSSFLDSSQRPLSISNSSLVSRPIDIPNVHHHCISSSPLSTPMASVVSSSSFTNSFEEKNTLDTTDDATSCYSFASSTSPELATPSSSPTLAPLSSSAHTSTMEDLDMADISNTSSVFNTSNQLRSTSFEFKQTAAERLYVWVYENNGLENERKHYAWIYTPITAPLIDKLRKRLAKYTRLVLAIRREKERKEYFKQVRKSDCKRTVPLEFYVGAVIADGSSSYFGVTNCIETEQQIDLRIGASCSNVHRPVFWVKCGATESEVVQFCNRFYKAKDHVIDELYKDKMCLSCKSSFI